ncbi:putative nucleotidyltransferase [Providencia alcalifaciens]|nr:putative nucleotidyltransferase [Providencia alcalifaciens]
MALDSDRFIKTLSLDPLQSEFLKVINDVEKNLVLALGSQLHSVYLYGSVAKGCAIEGVSDLDVCVILTEHPDYDSINIIADIRKVIMSKYQIVSKVDFDIGSLSEVLAPENLFNWGYWLKHQCRCIFGHDLACRFNLFKPSKAIAIAVNGDFVEVLDGYVHSLSNISDEIERKQLQRAAARKLIRSTNILRANEDVD